MRTKSIRRPLPVVVLSTADFDAPVWTNKQFIAVGLSSERAVIYVNSMGLRAPAFSRQDLRRIWARLRPASRRHRRASAEADPTWPVNVKILRPAVLPFHGSRVVQRVNFAAIRVSVRKRLPDAYILWTYSPLTYGLERKAVGVVYHCVDLLHELSRVPRETLLSAERELIKRADVVVGSSMGVNSHLRAAGANPLLWENVADVEAIQSFDVATDRENAAVFVGHFTESKVDYELLRAVADSGTRLLLAGPVGIDASDRKSFEDLIRHEAVEYLGTLTRAQLPALLFRAKVGLIPYLVNAHTAGIYPMKVYEYLAAGLAVVSTPLPSLTGSHTTQRVSFASHGAQFVVAVSQELSNFDENAAGSRQEAAKARSWSDRQAKARDLVRHLETGS